MEDTGPFGSHVASRSVDVHTSVDVSITPYLASSTIVLSSQQTGAQPGQSAVHSLIIPHKPGTNAKLAHDALVVRVEKGALDRAIASLRS